jgi:hypothetical protein
MTARRNQVVPADLDAESQTGKYANHRPRVRGLFVVRQDGWTRAGGEEESIREEPDSDAGPATGRRERVGGQKSRAVKYIDNHAGTTEPEGAVTNHEPEGGPKRKL